MANRRVSVVLDADVSPFVRGLSTASAATRGFARDLESADSRMANLVQAGLALAPALVPIGAAAVPAIAGLTLQLGLAAGAAGVAILAFQGVGDALKALDAYQLKPTAENLTKLEEELDKLGPAGQEFVFFLDDLKPKLQDIQDVAEAGLLPGVEDSLTSVLQMLPRVKDVVFTISSALGDLAAEGGANLAGSGFEEFFDYINTTARPVLIEMGRTFGNFVKGFANLVMDFDPLSRGFSTGLLDMSRSFVAWSDGLAETQGFHDFVDYIQTNGPKAMDALGSLGNALVQLVEAAAPVGALTLPIIEALGDGLAAIADSPVGPLLITTAAAVGVLGRSLALLKTVGLRGGMDGKQGLVARAIGLDELKTIPGSMRQVSVATSELRTAQAALATTAVKSRDAQFALIPTADKRKAVSDYGVAQRGVAAATERVAAAERERSAALRSGAAQFGKSAALVGGLALATSGLADKTGLSNTASLALMGTIAGPWGTAIGGGVGIVMDLAAANNDLEDAMKAATASANSQTVSFVSQAGDLADLKKKTDDYVASVNRGNQEVNPFKPSTWDNLSGPVDGFRAAWDKVTNQADKSTAAYERNRRVYDQMRAGAADLFAALNSGDPSGLRMTNEELDHFVSKIAPALQDAGFNVKDFLSESLNPAQFGAAAMAIQRSFDEMQSASGRSKAVGAALADLAGAATAAVDPIETLESALDSLFGVEMDQAEAVDAWFQSLADLRKQIADTNGTITGQSQVARDNRASINDSVQSLQARALADAKATHSGKQFAETLLNGRDAIIKNAVAAGAKRKDVEGYLRVLGLTPKNLTTIIEASGVLSAQEKVRALATLYRLTPKQVKTLVSQAGAEPSAAKVKALAKQYNLTPKQVRTLLSATDAASAKAKTAKGNIDNVRDKSVSIRAIDQVSPVAARAQAAINALQGKTVVVRTEHMDVRLGRSADGSTVPGPRHPYGDKVPYLLAPGEEVVSNRFGQADRFRGLLKDINANRLADGGTARERAAAAKARASAARSRDNAMFQFDLKGEMSADQVAREFHTFRNSLHLGAGALHALQVRATGVARSYGVHEAALKADRKALDDLRRDREQYQAGITDSFTSDRFGHGLFGLEVGLRKDSATASTMLAARQAAVGKGLDGGLAQDLFARNDLKTTQQIAALSKAEVAALEKRYLATTSSVNKLAAYSTQVTYGKQIADQSHLIKEQTTTLKALNRQIEKLEKRAQTININGIQDLKRAAKEIARKQKHGGR